MYLNSSNQNSRRYLKGILLLLMLSPIAGSLAEPIKVSLLSPEPPKSLFWGETIKFAEAVAEDLEIELDVVYPPSTSDSSSYIVRRLGRKILNEPVKPDFLLTGYWGSAEDLFESVAKQHNIRIFMFNTNLTPEERRVIGEPRERYPNWIGHMYPADEQAGYELMDILLEKSRTRFKNTPLSIVALSGNTQSQVSNDRLAGLQRRLGGDNLNLKQVFSTTWTRESAMITTGEMLNQYPDTMIVWAVSDEVALGSLAVLKKEGKKPGKDVLVGGFDWSSEGLKAVKDGEMVASMGGHFMEAGWALIEAYDYYHGHDFKDDTGVESVTPMQPITKSNVDMFLEKLGDRNWKKIDFRKFSKTYNPELKKYDFSLEAIFSSMHK